jgi:hypothetical protein
VRGSAFVHDVVKQWPNVTSAYNESLESHDGDLPCRAEGDNVACGGDSSVASGTLTLKTVHQEADSKESSKYRSELSVVNSGDPSLGEGTQWTSTWAEKPGIELFYPGAKEISTPIQVCDQDQEDP